MRRIISILTLAAAAAFVTPALAGPDSSYRHPYAAPVAGALVGTAVGVGLYHGWYGSSAYVTAAGATAGTAAVVGGVAGVGTLALIEGVTAKCHGFGIIWTPRSECVNGQWVGDAPRRRMSMR